MGSVATFLEGRSQPADDANLDTSFSDRVWRLLDPIDCRRADCEDELKPGFLLRDAAYGREGATAANSTKSFSDPSGDIGAVGKQALEPVHPSRQSGR